jgi:hypothetical protein
VIIKGFEPSRFESFYYFDFYGIFNSDYQIIYMKYTACEGG